jgi:hypothetical protein
MGQHSRPAAAGLIIGIFLLDLVIDVDIKNRYDQLLVEKLRLVLGLVKM